MESNFWSNESAIDAEIARLLGASNEVKVRAINGVQCREGTKRIFLTTDGVTLDGVVLLLHFLKVKRPYTDLMFFSPVINQSTLKQLVNQIDFNIVARIVLLQHDFKPEMNFIEWRKYSIGIKRTGCKCNDKTMVKRRYCKKKQYKGTKVISNMYFKSIGVKNKGDGLCKAPFPVPFKHEARYARAKALNFLNGLEKVAFARKQLFGFDLTFEDYMSKIILNDIIDKIDC